MPRDRSFARGLAMRYVAYAQAGARLGVLPDALAGTFTCPRQETPSLTLSYPNGEQGVRGTLLDSAVEIAVELCYDGRTWVEPYNARFTNLSSEWNLVEEGTEHRHADLIHIGHRLDGALVWFVPSNAMDKDGKYKFNSRNAGEILRTVWDAAVKRGWGAGLTLDVTTSTDSAGQGWALQTSIAFDPSVSIKSILDTLMNMGMVDYRWRGRTLQVYNPDGALKRENLDVVWRLGAGTTSAPEKLDWSQLCTHVLVKGDEGRTWTFPNPEAPADMPRTEKVVDAGGVELEATARRVADLTLKTGATPAAEVKREWEADDLQWLPFEDYSLGDWIRVERRGGLERMRVTQISISVTENGRCQGHTTFGTMLDDVLSRMAKRQKGILGAVNSDGKNPRPEKPTSKYAPLPPQGLVVSSSAVIGANGYAEAVASLKWNPVETDTLGVAVNVTGYDIAVRLMPHLAGRMSTSKTATAEVGSLTPGARYAFSVRAVTQDTVGAWSTEVVSVMATDTTPPPVPTAPVLSQTLGVLGVYWDGKGTRGAGMPLDYAGTEVSVREPGQPPIRFTDMPAPVQRTNLAGLEIREWEVCLRTYDRAGNRSAWGPRAKITLEQSIDAEAIAREVEKKLAQGDALQRAARESTLKEMSHLTEAMTQVATNLIDSGPVPPDSGKIGSSMWVAPDGRIFVLRAEGDK
uniref:FN3 protein n=1 Tax=Dulem virus 38 TaxID=3145756 RepID=A0AAU8B1Z3_9CAUD